MRKTVFRKSRKPAPAALQKAPEVIILEQWGEEFQFLRCDDPGMTTWELAKTAGVSRTAMANILKKGLASGRYIRGRSRRQNAQGRMVPRYVYRLANLG